MQSFWSCQGPLLHVLMEKSDGVKNIPSKLSFSIHHFSSNSHKEIKGSIYMPVVFVHKHQKDILSVILHKIQVTFILEFFPEAKAVRLAQGEKQAGQGQLSPLRNVCLSWENPTARTDGITSMPTQRLEVIQCSLCTNGFAHSLSVHIIYLSSSRQHYKKHIIKT